MMKELMKIELKKMSLKGQIKGMVVANIIIFFLLTTIFIFEGTIEDVFGVHYIIVDLVIRATFLIWQSVLISKLIVDEFKAKTIQQLYTYPIKRSKMMIAKVMLVFVIITAFILITQFIQHSLFNGLSLILLEFTYTIGVTSMAIVAVTSFFTVMVGMFPIAIGLWTKSTIAPVITSFLIMSVLGGNFGDVSLDLMNNTLGMLMLGIVGIVFTVFSIKDVLKKDLIV